MVTDRTGEWLEVGRMWSGEYVEMKKALKINDMKGKWTDILINCRFSREEDGFMKVWVNNKLTYEYTGPTKRDDNMYFKFGIYRFSVFKEMPTQVIYFDEVRIGKTGSTQVGLKYVSSNGQVVVYNQGARKLETNSTGVKVTGTFQGASEVGIQSGGVQIGAGITQLNFIGLGNTFAVNGTTVDVSISGNSGAGGTWRTYTAGIATNKSVGVNTNNLDDNDLVGVGNSFQGLYISNGMMITDNKLSGNHYIGTAFNGLMAGPVNIEGTLTIDGNYVVV